MTTTPGDVDPALVDVAALGRWMDDQGLPRGEFGQFDPIPGGTQNVMLRVRRGGRRYVLRRPPRHLRPRSNDALVREMRVLAALASTPVPVPAVIAACADPGVLGGAVFYLMEDVDGFNATVELPEPHAGDPALRAAMGRSAARAAAVLGEIDHEALGLGDLGHPEGFLERQVGRWLRELDSYAALDGYPGPEIPGVGEVARWLERHRPPAARPGLVHGDFHLANLLFSRTGPEVAAVVDWEMVTVGDPLLDLGWLLATWPAQDGAPGSQRPSALAAAGGLATPDELVACYAEHSSRDLSAITWYRVLACFKLGIVLEGTHARACAGLAPVAVGDQLHAHTLALFAQARTLIR
ncbi:MULTISPECIES: phosphotransferase family protein [unclassified Blastococcus]|uniref:phosphotransferase family protein n=1 Tax=unclassified Blastococcus TaxID=2619396 RepID=UPI00281523BB|nr:MULTISPECIES: phosphotransferase family protein [unclassified Blastococcus]